MGLDSISMNNISKCKNKKELWLFVLTIALLFLSVLFPAFIHYNDSTYIIILLVGVLSMYLIKEDNSRLWFVFIGIITSFISYCISTYVQYGKLELTIPFILRGFVLWRLSFFLVGVSVGYIFSRGLNLKLNGGLKWGLINIITSLIIVPFLIPIIRPIYILTFLFFIFSIVNGVLSNRNNIFKNFGLFMIPLFLYTLVFFVIDRTIFSKTEIFYPLINIISVSMVGTIIGYLLGKNKRVRIALNVDKYGENEN